MRTVCVCCVCDLRLMVLARALAAGRCMVRTGGGCGVRCAALKIRAFAAEALKKLERRSRQQAGPEHTK